SSDVGEDEGGVRGDFITVEEEYCDDRFANAFFAITASLPERLRLTLLPPVIVALAMFKPPFDLPRPALCDQVNLYLVLGRGSCAANNVLTIPYSEKRR
ncbi:MAG: hypothetical protein LKG22_11735, partial [Sphingobium sp.]|nr:hypothetical protein [Sphingobium sp.]